jgi:hypothetical protein
MQDKNRQPWQRILTLTTAGGFFNACRAGHLSLGVDFIHDISPKIVVVNPDTSTGNQNEPL